MKDKTCMPEMTEDGIRLLTTQEAAEYMGISYRQFLKIRKRGYCGLPTYPAPPCTMIGKNKKKFRYRIDELDNWIKNMPKFHTIEEYRQRFKEAEEEVAEKNNPSYTQNIDIYNANMSKNCVPDQTSAQTDKTSYGEQFINRDENTDTSYVIMQDGVPVDPDKLSDIQKTELQKLIKSFSVIKSCIQAIMSNDIFVASEFIRTFAEAKDAGSLEVIFYFARENAERLSFGMGMMINGCINEFSGDRAKADAVALLEGRSGQMPS